MQDHGWQVCGLSGSLPVYFNRVKRKILNKQEKNVVLRVVLSSGNRM